MVMLTEWIKRRQVTTFLEFALALVILLA